MDRTSNNDNDDSLGQFSCLLLPRRWNVWFNVSQGLVKFGFAAELSTVSTQLLLETSGRFSEKLFTMFQWDAVLDI